MRRLLRENGLSIVFTAIFLFAFVGEWLSGYNAYIKREGKPELSRWEYLSEPDFIEATTENWESEFLQMFMFVILTSFLYQRGSAVSKKLNMGSPAVATLAASPKKRRAPWPVRKGGFALAIYNYSLSLSFFILFIISFFLHAASGAKEYNEEQRKQGSSERVSTLDYTGTADFWFQSFQNWQSEFLAVGSMIVFSIVLRQKDSPESKEVEAPHSQTGD